MTAPETPGHRACRFDIERRADDGPARPSARRSSAGWLRGRMLGHWLGVMMLASAVWRVCSGGGLGPYTFPPRSRLVVAAAYAWVRSGRRWSLSNLEGRIDAE